jgi:hypothetical protein
LSKGHSAAVGKNETEMRISNTRARVGKKLTAWSPVMQRFFHQFKGPEVWGGPLLFSQGEISKSYNLSSFNVGFYSNPSMS